MTTAHRGLEVFVGTWRTVGRQLAGTVGPAAEITAVETYEWLAGERFMIHRFTGRVGDDDASCIEIFGLDAERGCYAVYTYYNTGMRNQWEYRERGGTWTLTGEFPGRNVTKKVRCTVVFADDGGTMNGRWEQSSDGARWQTFWEVTATKVGD